MICVNTSNLYLFVCISRSKTDDSEDTMEAGKKSVDEEAPVFVHWVDTVTVSSVESCHSEAGEETASAVRDAGPESEKGSKQTSADFERLPSDPEQQANRLGSLDKQQQANDVVVEVPVDMVSLQDKESDRLDGSVCRESGERVDLPLPDFVCPSSMQKSKEVLVKEWLSKCNMSSALRSLPLL